MSASLPPPAPPPPPLPQDAPAPHRRALPPTWTDKLFDGLIDVMPDWLAANFRSSQRQLVLMERRMQRRFLFEYRTQVRGLEPVLRARGEFVGRALLEAFTGHHAARVGYLDAEAGTMEAQKRGVVEALQALDPLLTPVLTPFVEGLKKPINETLGGVESDVKRAMVKTAAAALVAGWLLGRLTAPRGGGGRRPDN